MAETYGLQWPITIIDFEASSLEDGSYPIEVAVGSWNAAREPIRLWSSLIRPVWTWSNNGHWSRKSEKVHGIARADLASGKDPAEIVGILNAMVPSRVVWCDGGPYDTYWLRSLYKAAGTVAPFTLMDINALTLGQPDIRERMFDVLERTVAPHRAGGDVLRLFRALASAIGVDASVM